MTRTEPSRAVIVTGGAAHDFATSSPALAEVLAQAGIEAEITQEVEEALLALPDAATPPLLVLNLLRWSMDVPRYAHLREQLSISLGEDTRAALVAHLNRGGGVLAMHGASICFDDWPEWRSILGGVWNWESSAHPPISETPVRIQVTDPGHPLLTGIGDFEIVDEIYGFLDREPDVVGLISASHTGTSHPLLWAREVHGGRVVYDALGHDTRSYDAPAHRLIVQRAARWALHQTPTQD